MIGCKVGWAGWELALEGKTFKKTPFAASHSPFRPEADPADANDHIGGVIGVQSGMDRVGTTTLIEG